MSNPTLIEVGSDKFHEFLIEVLPKHHASQSIIDELNFRRFHNINSFKKNFINEILNNYYGMHYVGMSSSISESSYQLSVINKNLCTFFLLKYAN